MSESPVYNLSSININSTEGRLLMAALAMITTESRRDQEPDTVLAECIKLCDEMYKDAVTPGAIVDQHKLQEALEGEKTFPRELAALINRYSREKEFGNMPDFILAEHVESYLKTLGATVHKRDVWFNIDPWATDNQLAAVK